MLLKGDALAIALVVVICSCSMMVTLWIIKSWLPLPLAALLLLIAVVPVVGAVRMCRDVWRQAALGRLR